MAASEVNCWAEDGGPGGDALPMAGTTAPPAVTAQFLARLVRTIEGQVVPRLLLAQRTSPAFLAQPVADQPAAIPKTEAFVVALLRNDGAELTAYVESLRVRGLAVDSLLLELFAPSARLLGRMWEEDTVNFTQVTLALAHLHRLVHELRREHHIELDSSADRPRVLLTVTEDEQHLFGLLVVADFFRNAGWHVDEDHVGAPRGVASAVREMQYDLVGVSVSTEERVGPAAALVRTIRRASRNARVPVMAGGPVFLRIPEVADRLGVDAIACDGRQAIERARGLLAKLPLPKTRRV